MIIENNTRYYESKFYKKPIEVVSIGGEIMVFITDENGREIIYTWYDIVEKNTESIYINKCLLGGFIKNIPRKILIIGFGGGSFAKYIEDHIKDVSIRGIEIDEVMIEISKKELGVKTKDFYIMDAFLAVEKLLNKQEKFDLVLIDLYGGDGEVPEYLTDKIFFDNIKKILSKKGVVSINLADYDLFNIEKAKKYNKIHSNLIDVFGKYYSHLLSGKNDRGNVIGIYNLDKNYSAEDYDNNYIEKVEKGELLFE